MAKTSAFIQRPQRLANLVESLIGGGLHLPYRAVELVLVRRVGALSARCRFDELPLGTLCGNGNRICTIRGRTGPDGHRVDELVNR